MKAKIIKHILVKADEGKYFLFKEDETGFRIQVCEKLSLKNCQAIELDYDLDELATDHAEKITEETDASSYNELFDAYESGFQKCLEILGDKKFSEDDMKEAYSRGFLQQGIKSFNSLIQSLQQTEWDCIIEMECIDPNCDGINRKGECMPGKNPKIDASGCLILKRK